MDFWYSIMNYKVEIWRFWQVKLMKKLRYCTWLILALFIALTVYIINVFDIQIVTLYNQELLPFNEGWTLIREDGSKSDIALPYYEPCDKDEMIVIENVIPEKYAGKCASSHLSYRIGKRVGDGTNLAL